MHLINKHQFIPFLQREAISTKGIPQSTVCSHYTLYTNGCTSITPTITYYDYVCISLPIADIRFMLLFEALVTNLDIKRFSFFFVITHLKLHKICSKLFDRANSLELPD